MRMKFPKTGNTLYLKDLAECNTIEEWFNIEFDTTYLQCPPEPKVTEPKKEGNNYTPKLIRGKGPQREGYCNLCQKWFKMKTSSYWYHMNYKHGINKNGIKCPEPVFRNDASEVFCKDCDKWVVIGSGKQNSKYQWLKHWQKYHK